MWDDAPVNPPVVQPARALEMTDPAPQRIPDANVIFTGIGGQGVQLCSKVLANAAVAAGRHVMLSSYFGGEMRGGRTEATV